MNEPQLLWALVLGVFVVAAVLLTRIPYELMIARGVEPIRAVYYCRKIVHVAAAGLPSLLVPLVFTDFWYPMFGGILLGVFLHLTHATGHRMFWFQIEQNRNDVSFAIMWWISLSLLWWLLGDPWLAVLPALFMSFGVGITGVVRNYVVRRRTKHPLGNLFMLLVCVPIAWAVASQAEPPLPLWGVIAAVVASVVERYEIGPIDDNVLIAGAASGVLLLGSKLGPLMG